jgi:hypothetical protein
MANHHHGARQEVPDEVALSMRGRCRGCKILEADGGIVTGPCVGCRNGQ